MVGFRRSVRISAAPCVIVFSRVTSKKFEVHLRREFAFRRIFSCDAPDLTIKDFYRTLSTAITVTTITDLGSVGGNELVLASIWLHRQSRIRALEKFLQTVTPPRTIIEPAVFKIGRAENVCVRLFQILLMFIDKNRKVFKCSKLKMWVTFAEFSKPFRLTRIRMEGLAVKL